MQPGRAIILLFALETRRGVQLLENLRSPQPVLPAQAKEILKEFLKAYDEEGVNMRATYETTLTSAQIRFTFNWESIE